MKHRLHQSECSRRDALKLLAAGGAWLASGNPLQAAEGPLLQRAIPSTGEKIPAVGLGTYSVLNVGNSAAEREPVKEVVRLFAEKGGTVVDSSPMYGRSEGVVGDLSAELGLNDSLFLATKVWTRGKESGTGQMEDSMRLMRTDTIDLMQVHNLLDTNIHLATMREWQQDKRIRYLGVTHYHVGAHDQLEAVMRREKLDFVQLNYSIATRAAEERLLPLAADKGIAVLVNRPYEQGALFRKVSGAEIPAWAAEFDCQSWGQFFLKFILSHPQVTCVIPATSKPKHMIDNMQAGVGRLPDAHMRERMADFIAAL